MNWNISFAIVDSALLVPGLQLIFHDTAHDMRWYTTFTNIGHIYVDDVDVARLIPPYHIWSIPWPTCYLPSHTSNHVCVRKWHQMGHSRQHVADLRHFLQSVCSLKYRCCSQLGSPDVWTLWILQPLRIAHSKVQKLLSGHLTYAIPFETKIRYTQYTIRTGISVYAVMVCKRDSNELWNDIQPHTIFSSLCVSVVLTVLNYLSTLSMWSSRTRTQDTDLLPSCFTCSR